jgi:hypothetical protein
MMEEQGYNGWKNYPTWVVNLWLGNDQGTYSECSYMAREALRDAPHDSFKEYVTDLIDDESAGLGNDLIGYALGEVDWNEIADSWLESAKEEESYA